MRIKICGLFRDEDIDYVNEARPDYAGFVFAESKRQVSAVMAQYLRFRLASVIEPVGVFVNAPVKLISELYQNGIISIAQLHGDEDNTYIMRLKEITGNIKIIKALKFTTNQTNTHKQKKDGSNTVCDSSHGLRLNNYAKADFYLLDSGAGSGKSFNWDVIKQLKINKPWFLAGGIDIKNIDKATALKPFCIDVSSGVETNGLKDRKKILELTSSVRGNLSKQQSITDKGESLPALNIDCTTRIEHRSRKLTVSVKR